MELYYLKWGIAMEDRNWLQKWNGKNQLAEVKEAGEYAERFGLMLSEEDAQLLLGERSSVLKREERVEFGGGILPKLIYLFCDSPYLNQDNYVDMLGRLQEIFYLYKNEMQDEITDDELLTFMKEQFDDTCFGDLDYLEGTCLDIFAQAIRAGYRGHTETGGEGEFEQFDIVQRWDRGLYLAALAARME